MGGDQVAELVAPLAAQFGETIKRLSIAEPSLEDVFIARTGHRFWNSEEPAAEKITARSGRNSKRATSRSKS